MIINNAGIIISGMIISGSISSFFIISDNSIVIINMFISSYHCI